MGSVARTHWQVQGSIASSAEHKMHEETERKGRTELQHTGALMQS